MLGYWVFREIYGDLTLEHQSLYLLQPAYSPVMDAYTPEAGTPDHLQLVSFCMLVTVSFIKQD